MINRRNPVDTSDPRFRDFVATRKDLQIGTRSKNGWPHLASLWFAMDHKGVVLISYSRTQKVENLRRDKRVTLLWEDGAIEATVAGASVYGHAELIHGSDGADAAATVARYYRQVLAHHGDHEFDPDEVEQLVRNSTAKKTAIIVKPEKVIIWEHSDLCGVY